MLEWILGPCTFICCILELKKQQTLPAIWSSISDVWLCTIINKFYCGVRFHWDHPSLKFNPAQIKMYLFESLATFLFMCSVTEFWWNLCVRARARVCVCHILLLTRASLFFFRFGLSFQLRKVLFWCHILHIPASFSPDARPATVSQHCSDVETNIFSHRIHPRLPIG